MFDIPRKKLIAIMSTGLFLGLVISAGVTFAKVSIHGKFAPGTEISGIDFSLQTIEEVQTTLEQKRAEYLSTPITITLADTSVEVTPVELGIDLLIDQTLKTISEIDASEINIIQSVVPSLIKSNSVDLLVSIDKDIFEETLETHFQLAEKEPKSANFYFQGQKLLISDEKSGQVLEREELVQNIKTAAAKIDPQPITLSLFDQEPAITRANLEAQQDNIREKLFHKFTLIDPVFSDNWDLLLINYLDWVEFAPVEKIEIPHFKTEELEEELPVSESVQFVEIKINKEALNAYIDAEISKWLDRPAEDVNIYLDENGTPIIEGKGNDGTEVNRKLLRESIELAIANGVKDVPIPVTVLEPEVTISQELQDLGVEERISVGHTSYYGSPANRVHNIKTGAAKFDGLLIAPGDTFSFNKNLGPVDGSTGYRKELVIKPEGTIPEYGGGICQVSTTLYRTVLLSGLPIDERNQHSYAVSYYSQVLGHGLDATIYLGGPDLQFTNDTDSHILMQMYTKGDYELYVVFYGTDPKRQVELEGPFISGHHQPGPTVYTETNELPAGQTKQVEKPHTGFSAVWYRHIEDENGEIVTEEINTRYKAVPAKILVGTDPSIQE